MNLVVSALESMSSNCKEVIDSNILDCHEDQLKELKALNDAINGCFSVVNDLSICKESLEQCGYSQQWLDIINKDNKFLTICNIEMPRFFGGDETKGKACMEGITETLKAWLKKGWEMLKKIYAFLMGCIKAVLDFYKGEFGNKMNLGVLAKMREAAKKHYTEALNKVSPQPPEPVKEECIVEIVKLDDFKHYNDLLSQFVNRIRLAIIPNGKPINPGGVRGMRGFTIDSIQGNSGDAQMDVYSHLAQLAGEAGAEHNLQKDGFIVRSNGIEFLPLDAFPTEKVDIFVDAEWDRVRTALEELKETSRMQIEDMARVQKTIAEFQKNLETLIGNNATIDTSITLEEMQRSLQRTRALYTAVIGLVSQSRVLGTKLQITYSTIDNILKHRK